VEKKNFEMTVLGFIFENNFQFLFFGKSRKLAHNASLKNHYRMFAFSGRVYVLDT
jgi:hypothetical protein